ncbi:hypothetical protein [Streptomyces sp. NPDC020817]
MRRRGVWERNGPLHRGVHARPYREREPVSSFPVLMAAVGA